jgi:hypothetical protein
MKFKSLPIISAFVLAAGSLLAQPVNNDCANSINIQSAFGQPFGTTITLGPYDNTLATVVPSDPTTGFACFGEPDGGGAAPTIDNTMWFTFTGDGGKYFIETGNGPLITNYIDDGDTQIAIYTGSCGALVPFACNEDGPNATATHYPAGLVITTSPGTVYYMMVDGFNYNGVLSTGEYMLFITQQTTIACNDPSVTLGTASANKTFVCPNDTVRFDITGVVTPTVGSVSGLGWVISNADLMSDPNPIMNPALVAGYAVQSPAPSSSFRLYVNNGALIGGQVPYGTYYWSPVIFGNGTVGTPPGTFITQITLDPTCTVTGASIPVIVYEPGNPACATALNDIRDNGFGILNVHPVPVADELFFAVRTVEQGPLTITVTDITGREVMNETFVSTPGERKLSLDVKRLSSGVYHLTATSGQSTAVVRFVK